MTNELAESFDHLKSSGWLKIIRDAHADIAMRCATEGHDWRDDVPGIDGTVCICCGERSKSPSEDGGA